MRGRVIHQPKVAWEGARTVVAVARDADTDEETYLWFLGRLGTLLGQSYRLAVLDTRRRLAATDQPAATFLETGLWRNHLEDLLRGQPELTEDLYLLVAQTALRRRG